MYLKLFSNIKADLKTKLTDLSESCKTGSVQPKPFIIHPHLKLCAHCDYVLAFFHQSTYWFMNDGQRLKENVNSSKPSVCAHHHMKRLGGELAGYHSFTTWRFLHIDRYLKCLFGLAKHCRASASAGAAIRVSLHWFMRAQETQRKMAGCLWVSKIICLSNNTCNVMWFYDSIRHWVARLWLIGSIQFSCLFIQEFCLSFSETKPTTGGRKPTDSLNMKWTTCKYIVDHAKF